MKNFTVAFKLLGGTRQLFFQKERTLSLFLQRFWIMCYQQVWVAGLPKLIDSAPVKANAQWNLELKFLKKIRKNHLFSKFVTISHRDKQPYKTI